MGQEWGISGEGRYMEPDPDGGRVAPRRKGWATWVADARDRECMEGEKE